MATKIIQICDKCGKEEVNCHNPEGWKNISIRTNGYGYSELTLKNCLLCTDCLEKLGIVTPEKLTVAECHSLADQLYEVIAHIVAENQNQ